MFKYEFSSLVNLAASVLLFALLSLPYSLLNGSSPFLDAPLRLSTNSPFIETYFFWWTTLTYLPTFFFFTAFVTVSVSLSTHKLLAPMGGLFVLLVYMTEVGDFNILNFLDIETSYSSYALNTLLTNSLNKYHPFVFYLSTVLLLVVVLKTICESRPSQPFTTSSLPALATPLNWITTIVNLVALYMGSWWALEEGTWGGWWNWDSSEVFGLQMALSALYLNHSYTPVKLTSNRLFQSISVSATVLMSYFFIQLNFELVSHNFGSKFFFFFNNNLFFLEAVITSAFLLLIVLLTSKWLSSSSIGTLRNGHRTGSAESVRIKTFLPMLLLYWIFYSYKPLVNFFLWNFIGVNLLNSDGLLQPVNLLLTLLLLTWLLQVSVHSNPALALLTLTTVNWLWALVLLIQNKTRSIPLHQLLAGFTILNLSMSDVTPSTWLTQTPYLPYDAKLSTSWENHLSWGLDALAVNATTSNVSVIGYSFSNWNLITGSNSFSINFFSLQLLHEACTNFYNLGNSYMTASLELELPLTPSLPFIFFAALSTLTQPLRLPSRKPF